jgi:hypothetical protein
MQIKDNEVGGTRGTYGKEEKWFCWRNLHEENSFEDLDVDGMMMLKLILNK